MQELQSMNNLPEYPSQLESIPAWIWNAQNELNRVSHPSGRGTLDWSPYDMDDIELALQDYEAALLSEVSEFQDNFFWKHWSAEAREGRRWEPISEEAIQNTKVELADILFFLLSSLHLANCCFEGDGMLEAWEKSANRQWPEPEGFTTDAIEKANHSVRSCLIEVGKIVRTIRTQQSQILLAFAQQAVASYLDAACRFYSAEELYEAYHKKLEINFQRIERKRKQVGDTMAEDENKTI